MSANAPGQFHHARTKDGAHDHVVFHMSSGAAVVFNDPRRFGYMKVIARKALEDEPLSSGLGPEPLGNEFDAAMLARSCANKKTSLKAALLDQRVVAGLGTYVCEALCRAHLSPRRLAATLATKKGEPTDHAKRLVTAIHAVLNQAIKAGGSSLRDHRQTSGELGYFQHSFQVYDREGETCQSAGCSGIVKRFTQNGRSTFWCPKCQKYSRTRPGLGGPQASTGCVRDMWTQLGGCRPTASAPAGSRRGSPIMPSRIVIAARWRPGVEGLLFKIVMCFLPAIKTAKYSIHRRARAAR